MNTAAEGLDWPDDQAQIGAPRRARHAQCPHYRGFAAQLCLDNISRLYGLTPTEANLNSVASFAGTETLLRKVATPCLAAIGLSTSRAKAMAATRSVYLAQCTRLL